MNGLKLVGMIARVSPITFHPLPEDDPRRRCPDIGRAERLLRWKPKISLEQGLMRTITWFRKKGNIDEVRNSNETF